MSRTLVRSFASFLPPSTMDRTATFTPTALKRWSCIDKDLPKPASTNEIAVFDFDNTRELTLPEERSPL